jgi:septal ring-binding cell division protein DamX
MPAAAQAQEAPENDDAVALDSSQSEPVVTPATQVEAVLAAPSATSRLQRDLQASLEWINGRDSEVGTLQVMVLSQKRFDERIYYGYVERLARQGIDISQLRIFETYTNNQQVYSVVFGEFQNRRAANAAKADLPKILLETAPIPRSVGGLISEIQRLEAEN